MVNNFLKIAIRNLLKYRSLSFINLIGLTSGAACCLYILLYVQDQRHYDRHHFESENLYRVISDLTLAEEKETNHMATTSPPIAQALKMDFPEVDMVARVCSPPGVEQNLFRIGDRVFYEKKGYFADSTFFRIFDYQFVEGDRRHALDQPYSVVISENLAKKLFNTTSALNQSVGIGTQGGEEKFKVTGVFNDALGKSQLMPEFFMAMNSGGIGEFVRTDDSWAGNNFIYTYLRLKPNASASAFEAKLPAFLKRHGANQLNELHMNKVLRLQPLAEIHTTAGLRAEIGQTTGNRFLTILSIIAGFILLVACINFINLTTARSARRAQEVGVRKAVGAPRSALIAQFLGESMVLAVLAVAMAIPLIALMMPWLNQLSGEKIALNPVGNWTGWGMVGGLVLLTGLIAGSYPAFYLSSFKPVQVLRGIRAIKGKQGIVWLRKGLVVSQFVIASVLIIGAIVIRYQLRYMLEKDLGFEKEQKVIFHFRTTEGQSKLTTFRDALAQLPEVSAASGMGVCPGQPVFNDISLYKEGQDMNKASNVRFTFTDENYLNALKIKLLAGRFLTLSDTSRQFGQGNVVVNETALRELGIPAEQAVGKVLRSDFRERHFAFTIIGVMQDFFYETLSNKIDPFMVVSAPREEFLQVVANIKTTDYPNFLEKAGTVWEKTVPGLPFDYSFLDNDFAQLYQSEQTLARIIGAFTFIAILISCLGLVGLSMFTAEQRTKEIGVRKVLGASTLGITGLLSKEYIKLVLVALCIASPVAWWVMNLWLQEFANRISIPWWVFVATGLIALTTAFLTVSFQSVKAALANPITSLRSE